MWPHFFVLVLQETAHGAKTGTAVQEACEYCFPIKCMHDSVMLGTLLRHASNDGFSWLMGFEVSTKAELLLVISLWDNLLSTSNFEQPWNNARMKVICNGCKDKEYLELVDAAIVAGLDIVVMLENESDARFVVQSYTRLDPIHNPLSKPMHAAPTQVLPTLGLRLRLQQQHPGRCADH